MTKAGAAGFGAGRLATSAFDARASATSDPQQVFVLSRVTLGADVAVTSIVLDAAKRRFPERAISTSSDREKIGSCSRRTSESSIIRSHTRGMVRLRSELRRALDYASLIRS